MEYLQRQKGYFAKTANEDASRERSRDVRRQHVREKEKRKVLLFLPLVQ